MLSSRNGTSQEIHFHGPDRIAFFIIAMKMAIIDFENHGDWIPRFALRFHVTDDFEKLTRTSEDPYVHFAAIFSSLSRYRGHHAIQCLEFLKQNDPYLAKTAAQWVEEHIPDSPTKTAFLNIANRG